MPLLPAALLPLVLSGAAHAAVLKVASAEARSSAPNEGDFTYDAKNVIDGKQATFWLEGDDGSGLGAYVQLNLAAESTVTELRIWNGNWYTFDFFERYNRAKEVDIELSDGSKQKVVLKDGKAPETVKLDKPAKVTWVKVIVRSVYQGNTFNDSGFSEIQLIGPASPEPQVGSAFSASSVYPEDADSDYAADNVQDDIKDSPWCEGDKAGDGVGQWVQVDFGGPRPISKLDLVNGNAASFALFKKGNAVSEATLTFSDGSTHKISAKAMPLPQSFTFPTKTTSSVRLTVNAIHKGTEFNDLCVSELTFWP